MIKQFLRKALCILLMLPIVLMTTGFTYNDMEVNLPVRVEGYEGEVVFEGVTEGCPMPEITKLTILGEDNFNWSADEPGDYYYKVYQLKGKEQGVIYDETVYDALLTVYSISDTELAYHFFFFTDKGKPDELCFVNTKPAPPEPAKTDNTDNKPDTGDTTYRYMLTFFMFAAGLIFVIILKIRNEKEEYVRRHGGY